MSATLASHEDTVEKIVSVLNFLARNPEESMKGFPPDFWLEVLRTAASNGCRNTARLILLETGVAREQQLSLPIEDACRTNQYQVAELCLAYQSRCSLHSLAGALFWAARHRNHGLLVLLYEKSQSFEMAIVLKLMAKSGDPRPLPQIQGTTFADMMDELPQSLVLSNTRNFHGRPPDIFGELLSRDQQQLSRACSDGDLAMLRRVIARSSDEDRSGGGIFSTAFSEAIHQQRPGLLQYLCERLSRVKYFAAPALQRVRSTSVFQVLLDNEWTANASLARKSPPLLGFMTCSIELTRWHLAHGADPNLRCDWDITPLSVCIRNAPLSTVHILLRYGGDTRLGQQLHFALERTSLDQLAVIDMLLSFGANVNARMYEDDGQSWLENQALGMGTVLHKAVELGNEDVVAFLLDHGALCSIQDSVGRTALDIAEEKGFRSIVELIGICIAT
ncbi:hypothetical protein BST61_g11019 [Cercospora zeina]